MPAEPQPYAGRWVARIGGQVVGQGGTPRQARLAAKASRRKETPQVEFIPNTMSLQLQLPPLVERVRSALPQDQEIYLVGGAVRDLLLNRPLHDLDFVLPSQAIAASRKLANALQAHFFPLDETRDAGRLLLGEGAERVTLDIIAMQGASIDADLAERDLTINAMAIDLRQPEALLDPLGGAADLAAKRLRAAGPSSLLSDPIRVLRTVRFAASLGMRIEKDTRTQMRAAAPKLSEVSAERLRDELFRLLEAPKLSASLQALDMLGALQPVLPQLEPLKGVEQSPPHAHDAWGHSLRVIAMLERVIDLLAHEYPEEGAGDLASGLVVLRLGRYRQQLAGLLAQELVPGRPRAALLQLAAVFHDTGKAGGGAFDQEKGRIRFIGHESASAELVVAYGQQLRLSKAESDYLSVVVAAHGRPFALTQTGQLPSRRAIYRYFRELGERGVDVALLSLADFLGKYGANVPQEALAEHLDTLRALLEAYFETPERVVAPPPLLDGEQLMAELRLKPGRRVGEILEAVREAQAAGELTSRDEALALARNLAEIE